MAFLDNPAIILAHIRQSHVTSDDTGMCEMVLIDHDVDLEKRLPSSVTGSAGSETQGEGGDTQGCDLSQSVDITSSWDFGIRRRSNTAQRLERLRKERQNQIKCKNIQWKERNTSQSVEDLGTLFEKKYFKDRPASYGKQSTLSLRLEQCPQQLNNPFNERRKLTKSHVQYPGLEDLGTLFEKKYFKDRPASYGKQSTLSLRLEQCPQQLNNPFNEYSKFDGKVGETERSRHALLRSRVCAKHSTARSLLNISPYYRHVETSRMLEYNRSQLGQTPDNITGVVFHSA
ncbi:UNVERIFIED_CONTAM: hypothetical protein FKN15_078013 [Acipenser sinensis]